jgi:prevent-host-death family protein
MPEVIYNLYEAKTSLSRLVDRAANGEEIILSKAGKPLAKLVPYQQRSELASRVDGRGRCASRKTSTLPSHRSSSPLSRGTSDGGPAAARHPRLSLVEG